jgi:hypothetical protein
VQVINNVATTDVFRDATTLEQETADTVTYLVANASVRASFRPVAHRGGAEVAWGPELLLNPSANTVKNVSGVRFRSAVAGQPAQVIAILTSPIDPQLAAGTPFASTVLASGQVVQAATRLLGAGATASVNPLTVRQTIPGTSLSFTVAGDAAQFFYVASFDFAINPGGVGTTALGVPTLDGGDLDNAVFASDGVARATVACSMFGSITKGPHTFALDALRFAGAGTIGVAATITRWGMVLLDQ